MEEMSPAARQGDSWETAVLGGGCFWCLEAALTELWGVESATPGYSGGHVENPTYKQVCGHDTGHAEVVMVRFDPEVISLHDLLVIYFHSHDPTTLNRQGPDEGTQYRSVILYSSEEQHATVKEVMDELQKEGLWGAPFVTELKPLEAFYKAEETHQQYFARNPEKNYCRMVISPKIVKLRSQFADRLKART